MRVPTVSKSERLFAWLLRAFPSDFRQRFGVDMQEVFLDQLNVARTARGGLWAFWGRVLPSFLWAALSERLRSGRVPELSHTVRRRPSMFSELGSDVRHAFRLLRRSPVFATTSILIIALGVGAVTTTFSAMEALLLRGVPGTRDTDRVMSSQLLASDGTFTMTASPELIDHWRTRARLVEGVAGHTGNELTLTIDGAGVSAAGGIVTAGFFELLNVSPQVGRFFSAADDSAGSAPVAVLSHEFWQA